MSNSVDSDETAHLDLCCKSLSLSSMAVKELISEHKRENVWIS